MCSMHGYCVRGHYMHVPCVTIPRLAIPRVTNPRVAHDKLHETCPHATRKRGPRNHVMGLFKVLSCCYECPRV